MASKKNYYNIVKHTKNEMYNIKIAQYKKKLSLLKPIA